MKLLNKSGNPKLRSIKPQFREAQKKKKWNILRGDRVQVIEKKHPEYGKQGVVLKVDRRRDRVIVEAVNLGMWNIKGKPNLGIKGRSEMKERSIHYSNVNLVDPVTGTPSRVQRSFLEDGTKVRVSKKSGAIIPRPEVLKVRRTPMSTVVTESDTMSDKDVWEVTHISYDEAGKHNRHGDVQRT